MAAAPAITISRPTSPAFWWGLACTVLLDCALQLLWKRVAGALPDVDDPVALVQAALVQSGVWLMALMLLAQLALWLVVLRRSELSFAQPLTSLSYVGVGVLSWWWLHEPLHPRTVLSIVLILAGVWLVSGRSATGSTLAPAGPPPDGAHPPGPPSAGSPSGNAPARKTP